MFARGALHVHTSLSHDGLWCLADMAAFFRARKYQFVCITEHSEDMDQASIDMLRRFCAEISTPEFCVVPGIEYSCSFVLHIAGIGCDVPLDTADPLKVVQAIHDAGGFAVLAHPRRTGWQCSESLLAAVNAIETWNIRYDGKFLPLPKGIEFLARARELNSGILPAIGLDIHAAKGFYPASVCLNLPRLDRGAILAALIAGDFKIESPFWKMAAREAFSSQRLGRIRALRAVLDRVRGLRDRLETLTQKSGHQEHM